MLVSLQQFMISKLHENLPLVRGRLGWLQTTTKSNFKSTCHLVFTDEVM